MAETRLGRIKSAYASAHEGMPDYYDPLPAWEALPPQVREAIIMVYSAGCVDGAADERKAATRAILADFNNSDR